MYFDVYFDDVMGGMSKNLRAKETLNERDPFLGQVQRAVTKEKIALAKVVVGANNFKHNCQQ